MLFVRLSDVVENICSRSDWPQKDSDNLSLDLAYCSLRKPLASCYLLQDDE